MVQKKYDAIVVGAGLGGLSVATLLAKKKHSVLLLEKHNVPGGYATSFVRGRFEFETALHELSDIGTDDNPGMLRRFLGYLGVLDKVSWVPITTLYRSIYPELDVSLPQGKDEFTDALCREFPHENKGIKKFMGRIFSLSKEIGVLFKLQNSKMPGVLTQLPLLPFKLTSLPRYMFATLEDVISRDIKDERVKAVICQYWVYFGMPPSKLAFFYFALGLASYVKFGGTHINGRSQALSNAFLERFQELGGECQLSCGVEKITTNNGKVTGVITEYGDEILADAVVSNADQVSTCNNLIGLENVPKEYYKKLKSCDVAASSFNVYMGLNKPLEYFDSQEHEIFVSRDYDLDWQYSQMKKLDNPGAIAVTNYNSLLPDITPPDTSMTVLTALMYGDPWMNVPPEEYVDTKNRIADKMIDTAETIMPGLRENTEVVEVSTPITNMRYAGTLGGSIYGYDNTPFNHTVLRPSFFGPLKNLYFVGAWVQPGGGFAPAMFSGQQAGAAISFKLKTRLKRG